MEAPHDADQKNLKDRIHEWVQVLTEGTEIGNKQTKYRTAFIFM